MASSIRFRSIFTQLVNWILQGATTGSDSGFELFEASGEGSAAQNLPFS